MNCKTIAICLIAIFACPRGARAQYDAFKDAVVTKFNDADNKMAHEAFGEAVNAADPKFIKEWKNEKSGHSGSAAVLGISEKNGKSCRTIQLTHRADGQVGVQKNLWCKMEDGTWKIPGGK